MAANRDWVDDVELEGVVGPEVFSSERKDEQIWRIIDTAKAHGVNLLELAHACHAVWLACARQMAQRADALGYGKSNGEDDE
nr:MAG TPA: hypothetical protein [Caudoviricetes sp.]